jgi:hypothetical protein
VRGLSSSFPSCSCRCRSRRGEYQSCNCPWWPKRVHRQDAPLTPPDAFLLSFCTGFANYAEEYTSSPCRQHAKQDLTKEDVSTVTHRSQITGYCNRHGGRYSTYQNNQNRRQLALCSCLLPTRTLCHAPSEPQQQSNHL